MAQGQSTPVEPERPPQLGGQGGDLESGKTSTAITYRAGSREENCTERILEIFFGGGVSPQGEWST